MNTEYDGSRRIHYDPRVVATLRITSGIHSVTINGVETVISSSDVVSMVRGLVLKVRHAEDSLSVPRSI